MDQPFKDRIPPAVSRKNRRRPAFLVLFVEIRTSTDEHVDDFGMGQLGRDHQRRVAEPRGIQVGSRGNQDTSTLGVVLLAGGDEGRSAVVLCIYIRAGFYELTQNVGVALVRRNQNQGIATVSLAGIQAAR